MALVKLINNSRTDKNTLHSYLRVYDPLLQSKMLTAKNVLEIGIAKGGSIKLWNDFFVNATIYGVDIMSEDAVWDEIRGKERIRLYTPMNAYDSDFVQREFVAKGVQFDVVLDDGPHTLDSMKDFIRLYSELLTDDGILIIEDLKSVGWIDELRKVTPAHLQPYIVSHDLRRNKRRFDDILFIINKEYKRI